MLFFLKFGNFYRNAWNNPRIFVSHTIKIGAKLQLFFDINK